MTRRRERGHVRFHEGHWRVILPTMRRDDGSPIRPWFTPEENTEDAAKALLARKLVELDENRLAVPAPDTVGGWVEEFLEHHDVEPSTLSGNRQALRRRINHPVVGIGGIRLQRSTAVRLDRFYRDLKDLGYAKSTIQQTHRVLSVALKEAVRKRKLSYSPVQDATLPRFERRSRKALLIDRKKLWTPPELQTFLAHTREDRWYPVLHTIASTGLRRSEICGLREESVDLERAVIVVDWKVVAVHHELYEGDPKSESSVREITIDDGTVRVLRAWRKRKAADRLAAGPAWVTSGFEFTDELGRGLHPNTLKNYRFDKAVKSSGLRHTTPHGLRHLHATLLLDAELLIDTPTDMRRTERIRVTLAAWLRDGGNLDTPGLKHALAARTGAHTRTVECVLSEHRNTADEASHSEKRRSGTNRVPSFAGDPR